MKITVTLTTTIDRNDGTGTEITNITVTHAGDNPRHEQRETANAITHAVNQHPMTRPDPTNQESATPTSKAPQSPTWVARARFASPNITTIHTTNCTHLIDGTRQHIAYWSAPGDTIETFTNWLKERVPTVLRAGCTWES